MYQAGDRSRMQIIIHIFQVPLPIPIIMVFISLYLLIAPLVDDPRIEFLYAALFVLGGLIFYIPLKLCNVHSNVLKFYGKDDVIQCYILLLIFGLKLNQKQMNFKLPLDNLSC